MRAHLGLPREGTRPWWSRLRSGLLAAAPRWLCFFMMQIEAAVTILAAARLEEIDAGPSFVVVGHMDFLANLELRMGEGALNVTGGVPIGGMGNSLPPSSICISKIMAQVPLFCIWLWSQRLVVFSYSWFRCNSFGSGYCNTIYIYNYKVDCLKDIIQILQCELPIAIN